MKVCLNLLHLLSIESIFLQDFSLFKLETCVCKSREAYVSMVDPDFAKCIDRAPHSNLMLVGFVKL